MLALVSTIFSWFAWRFHSRAELELKLIALRHQVAVLNRQWSARLRWYAIDRMLWAWLYRVWPRCLEAMLLAKPATVVQWHRQGFRLYWRWRSRSGRRPIARETRKLIREVCLANTLWGARRIHGEWLKLGLKVSQATVTKYMLHRPHWASRHRHVHRTLGNLPARVRDLITARPLADQNRTGTLQIEAAPSVRVVEIGDSKRNIGL